MLLVRCDAIRQCKPLLVIYVWYMAMRARGSLKAEGMLVLKREGRRLDADFLNTKRQLRIATCDDNKRIDRQNGK